MKIGDQLYFDCGPWEDMRGEVFGMPDGKVSLKVQVAEIGERRFLMKPENCYVDIADLRAARAPKPA